MYTRDTVFGPELPRNVSDCNVTGLVMDAEFISGGHLCNN